MTSAADIIDALDNPAAVIAADGGLVRANTAAKAALADAGIDAGLLARLRPGETQETVAADGGLITWTTKHLAGGERLLVARRATAGLTPSEQYLASLSHELRTPLTAVLGMADLLSETRLAAEQRAYLSTAASICWAWSTRCRTSRACRPGMSPCIRSPSTRGRFCNPPPSC